MTRKEFIKRMDGVFKIMEEHSFGFHSCVVILKCVSVKAKDSYEGYIKNFTVAGILSWADYGYEDRAPLRMLLLQSFKEEVLSTRKYLEF